ncbi:nucleotide exchange factor GrpE [Nonlabens ponticola]|uniref:Protein GrpE n=1 Tax=Nonlabens ponticola TaxID=2496866 RepID=A0A3S9N035_9FLAO|nr:nucleotide exchange factor GrpE [Nonlabens ponticola]AZQ44749.1 nucleotide exchange factor GrpE [Nonlabens ponticola]
MGKKNKKEEKEVLQEEQLQQEESEQEQQEEERSEVEVLEEAVKMEKDKFLRLFAEFENFKRRTAKERIELFKTAGEGVLKDMIPVMDDFDRAMIEIAKSDDEQLTTGVTLIHNKLKNTLNSKGLEVIEVNPGDTFDAEDHEAVTHIPAPNDEMKGKIIDVIEKGYKLGDKTVRYPKVVIGK